MRTFREFLAENSADDRGKAELLMDAIVQNDVGEIDRLLKSGVDVNAKIDDGPETVLEMALSLEEEIGAATVQKLLGAGARLFDERDGALLLSRAAFLSFQAFEAVLKATLKVSPKLVDQRDDDGNTPAHYVVFSNEPAGAKKKLLALLDAGADVYARNDDGQTPGEAVESEGFVDKVVAFWRKKKQR